MTAYHPPTQDRIVGAGGAALAVVAIGYGLVVGLSVDLRASVVEDLKAFVMAPPAPPPPKPPIAPARHQAQKRKAGAASPPNLTAKATEVVAPPLVIRPLQPPPVAVASLAGPGDAAASGAALVAGPGSGSGGQGNGTGSGSGGDGDGGGGGTPLRLISGKLRYRDLPRSLYDAGVAGIVGMEFDVGVTGRVTACRITHTSGNADLDAATCALITEKLRYRPTRDASGRPVPDTVLGKQEWTVTRAGWDE